MSYPIKCQSKIRHNLFVLVVLSQKSVPSKPNPSYLIIFVKKMKTKSAILSRMDKYAGLLVLLKIRETQIELIKDKKMKEI